MKFLQHMILFFLINEMNSSFTRPKVQVKKSEELDIQRERKFYRRFLEKSTRLSKRRPAMFNMLYKATCRDLSRDCSFWRYHGFCSTNQRLMKHYCEKTCGFCKVLFPMCTDKSPYCGYWKQNGECTKLSSFMDYNCPKSCRKCRVDGSWGNWGEWSQCSQTCGAGKQSRYRECDNPVPENGGRSCAGVSSQQQTCNIESCIKVPATEAPTEQLTNRGPIKCGTRSQTQIVTRIVGGSIARPRDWPWQVALKYSNEKKILCGATLIDKEWAVTAGHCIRKFNATKSECVVPSPPVKAVMGEYDLLDVDNHEVHKDVDKICLHPNYDYRTLDYDIGLVHFKTPIESFDDFVTPICLPRHDSVTPAGTSCWITGFGKTQEKSLLSNHLQQAQVPMITREECQEFHPSREISNRMFCAGYREGEIDACKGDSGGPFVCDQTDGRFDLLGVISWGVGCGRSSQPGVYTDVRLFREWVDEIVNSFEK